jgi:transposase InsO family protein
MQACSLLGLEQAFTREHNPPGNAATERLRRTLKEACLGLYEWTCPFTVASALESWSAGYNEHDSHSALGYT